MIAACKPAVGPVDQAVYLYPEAQLDQIIEHAVRIERVGDPMRSRTEGDSTVLTKTTQIYQAFVVLDKDGHLVEQPTEAAARQASGPIIITTSCDMVCTRVRPGEECHISGCQETARCGCSQGSCGDNCTTATACHQWRSGFSLGRLVIF